MRAFAETPSDQLPRAAPGTKQGTEPGIESLYQRVREILVGARGRAWQTINATMVEAYWEIGRTILQEEQAVRSRADYGKRIIEGLSERLQAEFGEEEQRELGQALGVLPIIPQRMG